MKPSKRVVYALACIRELAKRFGEYVQVSEIAAAQSIPPAYCQKVLLMLSRKGFVESVKGRGFTLVIPAESIQALDVINALSEEDETGEGSSGESKMLEQALSDRIASIFLHLSVAEVVVSASPVTGQIWLRTDG